MDQRVKDIIREYQLEELKAANWRSLYQQVADLMLPREDQITGQRTSGEDKSKKVYDPTAQLDLEDMVSGLSSTFFPAGQRAFSITVKNRRLAEVEDVKTWLALAAQITHDELYDSNFMLQLNEVLAPVVGFGTGNLYSEWDNDRLGLNFKARDVASYTFKQNNKGQVDAVYLKFCYTARQAVQEFGDNAGPEVLKAVQKLETESKVFTFIQAVRPRIARNVMLVDDLNMPFESVFVNVDEEVVVSEGGFEELPYAVVRWKKDSSEKYGRGQGTQVLSAVKLLQQATRDWIDLANKYANPPYEVLDTFPGEVKTFPSAVNKVLQLGSIRGIGQDVLGNFPVTDQAIERLQALVHRAFFVDVFAPLSQPQKTHVTAVEVLERVKQSMKKLALPVYRLQCELFNPTITRCVLLLYRNYRLPMMPEVLRGQGFGIEYVGELALAMRDQQARAFQRFAQTVMALEPVFPGVRDMISIERALPDIALNDGLKVEHLSTKDEIAAKRQARQQELDAQKALQLASVATEGYQKTQKAPEGGSPAAEVMAAVGE